MEVNAVKHRSLLYDQVRHVTEQVWQLVHLVDDPIYLLFLYISKSRVGLSYFFNELLLLLTLLQLLLTFTLVVKVANLGQTYLTSDAIQFAYLLDVVFFNLSEAFGSVFELY